MRTVKILFTAIFLTLPYKVLSAEVEKKVDVQVKVEKPAGQGEKESLPLTQQQIHAVTPVLESLAETLAGVAAKYPELAEYQKEKVIIKSDSRHSVGWVMLSYSHNFTSPKAKRAVRPSDFGKDGFYINFKCAPIPPPDNLQLHYAMSPPTLTLSNLGLYLWTEVRSGPNPSSGIVDEVRSFLRSHAEKLMEIDGKISISKNNLKSKNIEPAVQAEGVTLTQIPLPEGMRSSYIHDPSWFPDSQKVAMRFAQRIVVVEVKTGKVTFLTEPNSRHCNPACAPDGRTIAYIGPMDNDSTIWLMDVDGEKKRPLVNVKCWRRPVWSPDSKRLAFIERNSGIWSVNADGSGLKQLTSVGSRSRPKWSPDGNLIAFVDNNNEICLMNADGSNRRVLTEIVSEPGYGPIGDRDDFYDWSPDGKQIVYAYRPIPPEGKHVTYDGGIHPYQIWIVNIDGSGKHCVTPEDISCGSPVWAPDKRHILYESIYQWVVTAEPTRAIYPTRNIWMLDLAENKKQQLTDTGMITEFALSPDGRKIVFSTGGGIFVAEWLENVVTDKQPEANPAGQVEGEDKFEPVVELVVAYVSSNAIIDLDTNKRWGPAAQGTPKDYPGADVWADFYATVNNKEASIALGSDMLVIPGTQEDWDITPRNLISHFDPSQTKSIKRLSILVTDKDNVPKTFLFKTFQDGLGVLQITGFPQNPSGVAVRYKLLKKGSSEIRPNP